MSDVKVTTLANGLRVAVDAMPEVESASLGIWVACGTRHESAELNGMAHMLEHMAFKGTRTRSARAIAEEIENVGGSLNAYTGREITAYHASVLKEDVALGVEMISDILRNSVFDPDELQRERGVILQEIGQALDTPDDLIFDQFQETALPGQPLGRPVLGTAESVEAIGRDDLFAYLARHYTASNMVLSAAGRVEHDQIVDLAEKHFGSVPRTPANADGAGAAALCRRRRPRGARARAGASGAGLRGHRLSRSRLFRARRLLDPVRRRHVLAPVPAHPRGARPGLRHPLLQHRLCRRRPVRHLCRHRRGRSGRAGAGGVRGVRRASPTR